MSKKVTPQDEVDLFERGLIIRRAWIMPPGCWEYSVCRVGVTTAKDCIATRSTRQAAYNAAIKHLAASHPAHWVTPPQGSREEE